MIDKGAVSKALKTHIGEETNTDTSKRDKAEVYPALSRLRFFTIDTFSSRIVGKAKPGSAPFMYKNIEI
ncbi:hypothetical protein KQI74_23275 [Paenibacillus barcinonensis]|uniref:hypothetical protein n=1 Tax=Paenibacillus barcinonensis TaxID=198119 RepID=UPI001C128446|nr:hypothetical protein [Paenibacillus barcinonensis]MBU5355183.1 hypothetical protein [Paenibacillus barcinonensis]